MKYETYIAIIIGTHRVISLCGQKHHKHKSKNTETLSVQNRKREETARNKKLEFNATMKAADSM